MRLVEQQRYWVCPTCRRANLQACTSCEACFAPRPQGLDQAHPGGARSKRRLRTSLNLPQRPEGPPIPLIFSPEDVEGVPPNPAAQSSNLPPVHRPLPAPQLIPPALNSGNGHKNKNGSDRKSRKAGLQAPGEVPASSGLTLPAEDASPLPLVRWWPDAQTLTQTAPTVDFFPALQAEKEPTWPAVSMDVRPVSRWKEQHYYVALILCVLLLVAAWVFYNYAPRKSIVTVKNLYWSVTIPIEKAQTVVYRQIESGGVPLPIYGDWIQVENRKVSGQDKDIFTPEVVLPGEEFRTGNPNWVFMVTFGDERGYSYPEFYTQEAWQQFEVGQQYQATIKQGEIETLQALP